MNKKIILITDGGGRGAVLVDKYGQSKHVGRILVVPGNDLMQINTDKKVITYPNLKTTSIKEILEIIKKEKVDLVDVSQDNAVEAGVVDEVLKLGINVVGPTKQAGQIEWDKVYSREFMVKNKIATPKFYSFNSEKKAIDFVKKNKNSKWFVKASGLAEGKGAIPAANLDEAIYAIGEMKKFGLSGETFLLEEWLIGEEFSVFAFSDGKDFIYVGSAQDHKRVNNGDIGANTGGMGCVSNPLIFDENIKKQSIEIFHKVINGLKDKGIFYKGVIYLGGMVVGKKLFVIEFNARWGDPEAEAILPSIENDYYEIGMAISRGTLKKIKIKTDKKIRMVVSLCSKGYPINYSKVKGKKITGIKRALKFVKIYGAGIKKSGKDFVVNGGRVLFVVAEGEDVLEAREKAYNAIKLINIEGDNLHFRSDIGWRDIKRLKK